MYKGPYYGLGFGPMVKNHKLDVGVFWQEGAAVGGAGWSDTQRSCLRQPEEEEEVWTDGCRPARGSGRENEARKPLGRRTHVALFGGGVGTPWVRGRAFPEARRRAGLARWPAGGRGSRCHTPTSPRRPRSRLCSPDNGKLREVCAPLSDKTRAILWDN